MTFCVVQPTKANPEDIVWQKETAYCYSLAFSPDSRFLASGHIGSINIWDVETGELLNILNKSVYSVYDLTFSHDGKYLAVSSANEEKFFNYLTVFDTDNFELLCDSNLINILLP